MGLRHLARRGPVPCQGGQVPRPAHRDDRPLELRSLEYYHETGSESLWRKSSCCRSCSKFLGVLRRHFHGSIATKTGQVRIEADSDPAMAP